MPLVLDEPGSQTADLIINGLGVMGNLLPDGALIKASADGTDWGNPEAVISSIQSQLQDGSLESHDRDDNREASIVVKISAPGAGDPGRAIALAQRELELHCRWPAGQVREMRWVSPLAGAQTTVFEMTSATVQRRMESGWDLDERLGKYRTFILSIHARPSVRGTTPVTIEAMEVGGSTTEPVDDGSSDDGWEMLSTAPATVTNLVTNPSFETNASGWSAGSGTLTVASVAMPSADAGSACLRVDSAYGSPSTKFYTSGPSAAVTAGKKYRYGGSFFTAGLPGNIADVDLFGVLSRCYDSGSTQVGADVESTVAPTRGAWRRWAGSRTMPAAATQFRLFPFARKVYSDFTVWNFDRAFVIEITDENPNPDFFDGNTPDTAAITYAWTGTANNSTSTATWTAPALAVVDGAVRGTVYGRATASIRRTGTIDMSELPYLRITGTATAAADGQVSVADDGSVPISPLSYSYNGATGAYEIVVKRPEGFTNLGVTFTRNSGAVSTTGGIFVAVDSIEITDAPFGTGRVQTRQVPVYGSQRTEVSIDVRGLDTDGTTPVGLGAQVLVCTSAAGDDGRAKSLAVRAASTVSVSPTSDSAATSGSYNPLATIASGNYPTFELDSSALLPGTFDVYASIYAVTAATHTVSLRADLDHGLDAVRVGDWQDTIVTAVSSGAVWPQILEDVYRLMPVGEVTVGEDGGILSLSLASASTTNMRVDDLFLLHRTASQVSLINTASSSGSLSRVRLDAATVTRPRPSAWVGQVGGAMMDAALAGRCQAFAQHQAEPGLLQFFTVTPGCSTSRVSATYYERFAHDAASILAGAA